MSKIRFGVERTRVGGFTDTVYVLDREIPGEAIAQAVWDTMSTDVWITVAGVRMHAAGWANPDHWVDEWMDVLGVDRDDVPEAVGAVLLAGTEP